MRKWNRLMLIVVAATVGGSLSAQTCKPSASPVLTDNAALLSSPRYQEEHPELLRGQPSSEETPALRAKQLAALSENVALANSPRFREIHPELLLPAASAERLEAFSKADRGGKLTENRALAASPRYREEHPELSRGQNVFEIAPVK
jgi:hypothetical protein